MTSEHDVRRFAAALVGAHGVKAIELARARARASSCAGDTGGAVAWCEIAERASEILDPDAGPYKAAATGEIALSAILDDPLTQALMRSDHVYRREIETLIARARKPIDRHG